MRVSYEADVREIADTSLERYRRVPAVRRIELGFGAATALLLGAATGTRVGGATGVAAGLASALLAFLVYRWAARALQARMIRRSWAAHLGAQRVPVEIETAERGLVVRYGGHETVTPWAAVHAVEETPRGLVVRDGAGALVRVPRSAFADESTAVAFRDAVDGAAARN